MGWGEGGVGEEGAGEVANGGYDCGEVVATVPEAVVGGLVAEDLVWRGGVSWMRVGVGLEETYEHQANDD